VLMHVPESLVVRERIDSFFQFNFSMV